MIDPGHLALVRIAEGLMFCNKPNTRVGFQPRSFTTNKFTD
jgi:hypothetical protein